MIRVLIVEDSPTVRELLVHILETDPELKVVGTACDGEQALEAVERLKPDVITMDINMPKRDGFEATREIMSTRPTPIVIISGHKNVHEVEIAFRAVEAGALALVPRPHGFGHPGYATSAQQCIQTVKLMSEVPVVRRWRTAPRETPAPSVQIPAPPVTEAIRVVAIGASTGGPKSIETILAALPRPFPVPILIVQHMAPGFIHGFADWLAAATGFTVSVAQHGQCPCAGQVYVAPDDWQMGVDKEGRLALSRGAREEYLRPSVSFLFRSLVNSLGRQAVCILLTGMGKDGAAELKAMKEKGAITIAQDSESTVVNGMPGEAVRLGAATYVLAPTAIATLLAGLVGQR